MGTDSSRRRGVAILVGAVLGTIAWAPSAFAASVSVDSTNGVLSYVAGAGEPNELTIVRPEGGVFSRSVQVTDLGATIAAGAGCSSVSDHEVICIGVVRVRVEAGDLDDSVTVLGEVDGDCCPSRDEVEALVPAVVSGGEGDDTLTGGDAPDSLAGGGGEDTLSGKRAWARDVDENPFGVDKLEGQAGNDILTGGEHSDRLAGGEGSDLISGGPGFDTTDYSASAAAVVVTLDGLPGDGAAGENDNVRGNVEAVLGTAGNDTLIGNDNRNTFFGSAGEDTLVGGRGRDVLLGAAGDDRVAGGPGPDDVAGGRDADVIDGNGGGDFIQAGSGDDTVRGGLHRDGIDGGRDDDVIRGGPARDFLFGDDFGSPGGDDTIIGGSGPDFVHGFGGNDTFRMRDGEGDRIRGGRGFDRARVDRGLDSVRAIESFF